MASKEEVENLRKQMKEKESKEINPRGRARERDTYFIYDEGTFNQGDEEDIRPIIEASEFFGSDVVLVSGETRIVSGHRLDRTGNWVGGVLVIPKYANKEICFKGGNLGKIRKRVQYLYHRPELEEMRKLKILGDEKETDSLYNLMHKEITSDFAPSRGGSVRDLSSIKITPGRMIIRDVPKIGVFFHLKTKERVYFLENITLKSAEFLAMKFTGGRP